MKLGLVVHRGSSLSSLQFRAATGNHGFRQRGTAPGVMRFMVWVA